jgi:hypothetical protein
MTEGPGHLVAIAFKIAILFGFGSNHLRDLPRHTGLFCDTNFQISKGILYSDFKNSHFMANNHLQAPINWPAAAEVPPLPAHKKTTAGAGLGLRQRWKKRKKDSI